MPEPPTNLPEPLRDFRELADTELVSVSLREVEGALSRYRREWDAGRIAPNSIEALRVELTYHSNAIEGNTLSLRETQLVLEGLAPPGGKPLREIYEARNHDRALRMLEQWVEERSGASRLTERDLLDIHAQVLADIDPRHAGAFREGRVLIAGSRFVPPGPHKFGGLIPRMLELANREDVPPALLAVELHYNLVAIHPFSDGNGRTARLLMNYQLLRRGYPLAVLEVERRGAYLSALEEANVGRLEPFAALVLGCVSRTISRLIGEEDD